MKAKFVRFLMLTLVVFSLALPATMASAYSVQPVAPATLQPQTDPAPSIDPNGVAALIAVIAGILGMPIINWIKGLFGWEDKQALAASAGISIFLGVLIAYLNGVFTGMPFDLDSITKTVTIVFSVATIIYKALQKPPDPQPVEVTGQNRAELPRS